MQTRLMIILISLFSFAPLTSGAAELDLDKLICIADIESICQKNCYTGEGNVGDRSTCYELCKEEKRVKCSKPKTDSRQRRCPGKRRSCR